MIVWLGVPALAGLAGHDEFYRSVCKERLPSFEYILRLLPELQSFSIRFKIFNCCLYVGIDFVIASSLLA